MTRLSLILLSLAINVIEEVPPIKKDKFPDLSGYYRYSEISKETGKKYYGAVLIEKQDSCYSVQWIMNGQLTVGCGMVKDNSFMIGWKIKDSPGISHFRIQEGKLVGSWVAFPNNSKLSLETLTFISKLE